MNNHFHTAWQRIRRSPYQSIAAVSIMTMTLFLACVFSLIAVGSQAVLKFFESRPQVNAFYKSDVIPQPQDIERIKAQFESTGKISSFKYVSQEEALNIYKELNKSDPLLLEAVSIGMLPASIEVSAQNPNDLQSVADDLRKETGIEDVRFAGDVVASLTRWTNSVRIIGLSLVGTHIVITFIIIILILGIKIATRKEEISTLQLLGATPGFISAPFIYEGFLYGVWGAILAWGITYILLLYSMGFLVSFLSGVPILPPPILFMIELLGVQLALGAFVGGLGGIIATKRFLKV